MNLRICHRACNCFQKQLRILSMVTSLQLFFITAAFAASNNDWERLVKEAAREGKVVIAIPLGEAYPRVIATFQKSFPMIKAETFSIHTRDFMARFRQERAVGQVLWDALIGGPDSNIYQAGNQGLWDPVLPELVLPEVRDNSEWRGGIEAAFSDLKKTFSFNYISRTTEGFYVNREYVPESELPSVDGLQDPKWAGKIS